MTTELEKQFFQCFEIEKIYIWKTTNARKMYGYKRVKAYPQITDKILLKLICINNSCAFEQKRIIWEEVIMPTSYKYLKESVLSLLMLHRKDFSKLTHQVQAIFKGEN